MRKLIGSTLALGLYVGFAQTAQAGEVTRVATAFEEKNRFDFHFGVAYDFNLKKAAILREWNTGSSQDQTNRLVKDLEYQRTRHVLSPSLEIGFWHDFALYVAMPIVLSDRTEYAFDQRADDCIYGENGDFPEINCVNKNNSTTVRDGIIPRNGFDASESGAPFTQFTSPDTGKIFVAPTRRGLDQLHVGLKFGIMNQNRYSHLPNWVLGLEGRFAVGKAMTMSREIEVQEPEGNTRVGRRIHELGAWTALSRRYRFLDPFFTAFWRQSVRANASQFDDLSHLGSQDAINPQSSAGVSFGAEIVPWERKAKGQKVAIFLQGHATLKYGGRGYSEIWQLLADSPALVGKPDPASSEICDEDAAKAFAEDPNNQGNTAGYLQAGGSGCRRFNGITDIQDYASFGMKLGANFHLGKYARLMLGTNLITDTRHFLTNADRGDDKNGNDLVDPDTTEVNPVRRNIIDNVGRRYVIDDVFNAYAYMNFLLTF